MTPGRLLLLRRRADTVCRAIVLVRYLGCELVSVPLAVAGDDCRKIAVLGEMLELGDDGIQMHRDIAQHCRGIDGVITVGEGFRDAGFEEAPTSFLGHFASADDIPADWLDQQLGDKGVLLVKGSNRVFWTRNFVNRLVTALAENGQ